jgi:hypothetical protein
MIRCGAELQFSTPGPNAVRPYKTGGDLKVGANVAQPLLAVLQKHGALAL